MAFQKKTWKNRISEFFNRYRLENVKTGEVSTAYINLNDGAVEEEGDKINADALNDLEDRIEAALEGVGTGSNFVGTRAEWNALTDEEKGQYDTYDITDDFEGYVIDTSVNSGSTNVVTGGAVANHLVVGNKKFYFDYQDGKYGYNTSANRGADTFFPFKGMSTSTELIASNYAARAYADAAGYANISYTATEDCYVFGVAAAYIANSNPGVGSITTSGGTVLLSNSHVGAYYLCVNYALIKLPRGASVTVTNTGGGGSNYSGRLTAYYAFKI